VVVARVGTVGTKVVDDADAHDVSPPARRTRAQSRVRCLIFTRRSSSDTDGMLTATF
jgi:hypothetical protein